MAVPASPGQPRPPPQTAGTPRSSLNSKYNRKLQNFSLLSAEMFSVLKDISEYLKLPAPLKWRRWLRAAGEAVTTV